MKIGILGSVDVAKALGNGFLKYGYSVMLGTRSPEKLGEWKSKSKGTVGSFAEAAKFGEIVVLAVSGKEAGNVLAMAGTPNISGKTVIDVTNPIDHSKQPEDGVLHYYTSMNESQMEILQEKFPDANFVKAFNSVGNAFMVDPPFSIKPSMFYCGNDESAKKQVKKIIEQFGWEPEDMGGAKAAGAIESLCVLWCIPGLRGNEWMHAFKLVKK